VRWNPILIIKEYRAKVALYDFITQYGKKIETERDELLGDLRELQNRFAELTRVNEELVRNNARAAGFTIAEAEDLKTLIESAQVPASGFYQGRHLPIKVTGFDLRDEQRAVVNVDLAPSQMIPLLRLIVDKGFEVFAWNLIKKEIEIGRRPDTATSLRTASRGDLESGQEKDLESPRMAIVRNGARAPQGQREPHEQMCRAVSFQGLLDPLPGETLPHNSGEGRPNTAQADLPGNPGVADIAATASSGEKPQPRGTPVPHPQAALSTPSLGRVQQDAKRPRRTTPQSTQARDEGSPAHIQPDRT